MEFGIKKRIIYALLAAEAAICAGLTLAGAAAAGAFSSAMAFPYEQLGLGLRRLSLSGGAGNAAAIGIYVLIALAPIIYWAIFRRRGGFKREDILLPVMSVALLGGIYIIINPGWMPAGLNVELERAMVGCALHSIWTGYVILRALGRVHKSSRETLMRGLRLLIWIPAGIFVYIIAGSCVRDAADAFSQLASGNTMGGSELGLTRVFLIMGYINSALAYAADLPVISTAAQLTEYLEREPYGEEAALTAERLSRRCKLALCATVASGIAFNCLQLIFAPRLLVINASMQLPLASMIFALAALIGARYIRSVQALKQDNDLFI